MLLAVVASYSQAARFGGISETKLEASIPCIDGAGNYRNLISHAWPSMFRVLQGPGTAAGYIYGVRVLGFKHGSINQI